MPTRASAPPPKWNPDPSPTKQTSCPGRMRPLLRHSSSAMGIVAAVVFPYFWMLLYTRWSGSPSAFCTASLMRRLAWCAMSRSISPTVRCCFAHSSRTACDMRETASLNTARPFISGT